MVVVNDGSTDRTGELLDAHFGGDPRVRILHQPNRGKSAALTHALREAHNEIVVTIDADTSIDPKAISKLVRHFVDPRIGAVAGNVKVGNRTSWLTRWQALEYITSQNLEKRAFDLLNCIPVVPGALSAWRAEAIAARRIHAPTPWPKIPISRSRFAARLANRLRGRSDRLDEAPETASTLIRQRFRWTFGTLQAFWKHRDTLGRTKLRYARLDRTAQMFLFQLLLPLFSPVIDLLFLGSLVLYGVRDSTSRICRSSRRPRTSSARCIFRRIHADRFLDLHRGVILERHEDWSLLWPLLLQRFYYRQMMYYVLFRSVMGAVQGRSVGWRGVEPEVPAAPVAQVKA